MTTDNVAPWPALPWDAWQDTGATLHMWTQIVGKVKLALAPFLNEFWEVGFHLTARGMTTGIIPTGNRAFAVDFDFIEHRLYVAVTDGQVETVRLEPRSVADFYAEFMGALRALGIDVSINPLPVESVITTPFAEDHTHASYDAAWVNRWWLIQVQTAKVLQRYRSTFSGKSSPILFYWGSFDLAEVRYSGNPAPQAEGPRFYKIAEDEENVSCGFWPGNPTAAGIELGEPAFYSYTNPKPDGIEYAPVRPDAASWNDQLGEFILLYEDVRNASDPAAALLDFFQTTYEAGANLAGWDRARLERSAR